MVTWLHVPQSINKSKFKWCKWSNLYHSWLKFIMLIILIFGHRVLAEIRVPSFCWRLSFQMNISTLYNNCYVILATYMLDSALEPSYNLSKNLLLLPWILKLIVNMVNDSTPPDIWKCQYDPSGFGRPRRISAKAQGRANNLINQTLCLLTHQCINLKLFLFWEMYSKN